MTEVIWPVKMKILYGLFRKSVPIPARCLGFMGGRMGPGRQPQDRPTRRVRPAPWGDGGGRGESRCCRKLEIWSQADSESTRLLQRAGGGLRGLAGLLRGFRSPVERRTALPPPRRRPPAAAFNPTARVHPSWHGRRAQCGAWKPDGTCDAKKTLPWEKDPTL